MFNIGDRVVCIKKYGNVDAGETGRFVHRYGCYPEYGVEWEIEKSTRHSCNGHSIPRHGFYVPEDSIRLTQPADFGEILNDYEISIENFLFEEYGEEYGS